MKRASWGLGRLCAELHTRPHAWTGLPGEVATEPAAPPSPSRQARGHASRLANLCLCVGF